MSKPQDYFFMVDEKNKCFLFVLKDYWHENQSLDDNLPDDFEDWLPVNEFTAWANSMEATYECYNKAFNIEDITFVENSEGIRQLVEAGFTQIAYPEEWQ